MPEDTEILILELGVSEPGDMDLLGAITYPDIAVVTCVGPTHTEFLGDAEGVAREKGRLIEYIVLGGIAVLNADDELVIAMADALSDDVSLSTFGINADADTFASDVVDEGVRGVTFKLDGEIECRLPLPGIYNLYNALAAAAVAKEMGLSKDDIATAIEGFESGNMRSQVIEKDGVTYIVDCYNSSPKAARAALNALSASGGDGRTWAVLGEMRELGDIAEQEHRSLGRYAVELGVDYLVVYGEGGRMIVAGAADASYSGEAICFESYEETAEYIMGNIGRGDVALFKASRGVELENILKIIGVIE
jgi:UDP-N-acetylmuramoyl-tripeptide--D-alanyl-D-alanine ligase